MKFTLALVLFSIAVTSLCSGQESEDSVEPPTKDSWWGQFKVRAKSVFSKWREDLKGLWDEVLAKASDMRSWTSNMFDSFKVKLKEWMETRGEVPDVGKNEIENFIDKLRIPTTIGGSNERSDKTTINP